MGRRCCPFCNSSPTDGRRWTAMSSAIGQQRNHHASSTLDFRLRTIISRGFFLMPMALFVFISDDSPLARLRLFSRRQLRGFARLVMAPEGFRECLIDFVRPTAIVSNDFINNLAHANSSYVDRHPLL